MKTRFPATGLVAMLGLVFGPAACNDGTPAGPEIEPTAPEFAKQGKGPHPKSTTLPLTVVIESNFDISQAPLNATANRLLADGGGAYSDGVEGVEAFVRDENADESIISGRTLLGFVTDARAFWVDLRPAADGTSVVVDPEAPPPPLIPWSIDDACGTNEFGSPTDPCESTHGQYLSTRVPDTPGPKTARLAAFWLDGGYQYRLFFGKTCRNDEIVPENYLDVVEVQDAVGVVIGWDFVATTQYGYLGRWPTKGRPRRECLGRVQTPFTVHFRLK